jgi:hypothetical protein
MMFTRGTATIAAATLLCLAGTGAAQGMPTSDRLSLSGIPGPAEKITAVVNGFPANVPVLLLAGLAERPNNLGFVTVKVEPIVMLDYMGLTDATGYAFKRFVLPPVFSPRMIGMTIYYQAISIQIATRDTFGTISVEQSEVQNLTLQG